jgi:hypothetical protein
MSTIQSVHLPLVVGLIMRLWERDLAVLRETKRSPLLVSHIWRLCRFSSLKKASARTHALERAGLIKSCPSMQNGRQGCAPKVLHQGPRPPLISLPHKLLTAELRVQAHLSFPPEFGATFYYGHELTVGGGLRPDAALVVEGTALVCCEVDRGTERLCNPHGYSLLGKLLSYANYLDSGQYVTDFSFAGVTRGFRVAVVLTSPGRLVNLQRLLATNGLDFVLLATMDDVMKSGLRSAAWRTHTGMLVNLGGEPAL